jgi:acyl-CoA synthetase (AMP-forming)/AMP-acid ligase II
MPGGKSLTRMLYDGAAINMAAIAVENRDDNITFEELIGRVESMGAALQKLLPTPGSRIALCAGNHADHLIAYLAILISGFVWVPLNPANGRPLNTTIANKAKPDLVLIDRASIDKAPDTDRLREQHAGRHREHACVL